MGYVTDDGKIMIDVQKQNELIAKKVDCLYKNLVKDSENSRQVKN